MSQNLRVVLVFSRYDPVEAQIAARQRIEMIGRLASGIARDLNNMLGALQANLEYLDDPRTRADPTSRTTRTSARSVAESSSSTT